MVHTPDCVGTGVIKKDKIHKDCKKIKKSKICCSLVHCVKMHHPIAVGMVLNDHKKLVAGAHTQLTRIWSEQECENSQRLKVILKSPFGLNHPQPHIRTPQVRYQGIRLDLLHHVFDSFSLGIVFEKI